jgi:hypothetical protein
MSQSQLTFAVKITDSWGSGYNGFFEITPKITFAQNNYTISLTTSGTISWMDNFDQVKTATGYLLKPKSWLQPLKANITLKTGFGASGKFISDSDFKVNLDVDPEIKIPPPISEVLVQGLPNDKCFALQGLNTTLDLSLDGNIKDIYLSNPTVVIRAGFKFTFTGNGSCCMKIIKTDGKIRLFGIFIGDFKNKFQLGCASEDDPQLSLGFWTDFEKKGRGKYCQMRYIYLNGGPGDYGWRMNYGTKETNLDVEGMRAITFIRNSLRLGMIPCFVYYNVPDNGESYDTDLRHLQSESYMTKYYADLYFLLTLINRETDGGKIPTCIILEPDLIGYIMQNSGGGSAKYILPNKIQACVSPIYSLNYLKRDIDGTFTDTLDGFVKATNTLIRKIGGGGVVFGWQINLWASSYSGKVITGGSLMKVTDHLGIDNGKAFLTKEAQEIAFYYQQAGIDFKTDFFSVDKYGLSFRGVTASDLTDAKQSMWGFNHDHWMNYLLFVKTISTQIVKNAILWQIPVSHLNSSQTTSPYTSKLFQDLTNTPSCFEDSAATFFFGDVFIPKINSETEFWKKNDWKTDKVVVDGAKIKWGGMVSDLKNYNVIGCLFGAGVGIDTNSGGLARPVTDDYFLISNIQKFYSL